MNKHAQTILEQAMTLSPGDRAELAGRLFDRLAPASRDLETSWREEIASRTAAYDAGDLKCESAERVLQQARDRPKR